MGDISWDTHPMTTSLRDAVRKACDNVLPVDGGCQWPSCDCHMTASMLTGLIDQASVEEREAAAQLVAECAAAIKPSRGRRLNMVDAHTQAVLENAAAAIRTRATGGGE